MSPSKRPRPRKRRAIALQNLKIKKVTLNKSSLSNSSFHQGLAETSTLPSCSVDSDSSHSQSIEIASQQKPYFSVEGRRIVDMNFFIKSIQGLNDHSPFSCNFSYMEIIKEKTDGLISTLTFKCKMCNIEKEIATEDSGNNSLNLNVAQVMATISTGSGYSDIHQQHAALNIPVMSHRQYAKHTETVADIICQTLCDSIEEAGRFPMDNERREAWRFALNINSEDIFKYSRVCHLHFNGDAFDYEKSPFSLSLKKNAIPSERVALADIQCSVPDIRPSRPKLPPNSPTIKNDSVTETQDSNISSDQEEVVDSETIDPLRSSVPSPKPRTSKRSYTTDPILEKAQNLLSNFGKEMKNEYASFGEHIANKLRKYDDYIRSEAEMKIMQILYECDMQMYKKRRLCTCTLLESPDTNS